MSMVSRYVGLVLGTLSLCGLRKLSRDLLFGTVHAPLSRGHRGGGGGGNLFLLLLLVHD